LVLVLVTFQIILIIINSREIILDQAVALLNKEVLLV
jgi:hypothetical protein